MNNLLANSFPTNLDVVVVVVVVVVVEAVVATSAQIVSNVPRRTSRPARVAASPLIEHIT